MLVKQPNLERYAKWYEGLEVEPLQEEEVICDNSG